MSWGVVVVRNDGPEGTKAKSSLTPRERFRIKRDVVYTRRKMRTYGLFWFPIASPTMPRWKLVFDDIEAVLTDAGLMSYCVVTVDGVAQRLRHPEEGFAGFGGAGVAALRGVQHVIALLEERAKLALEVLDGPP